MLKKMWAGLFCIAMVFAFYSNVANASPVSISVLQQSVTGWNRNFNPFTNVLEAQKGFAYEPLVIYNGLNNEEIPWLAEEVIIQDDAKTIDAKIRKGIKWSDGKDFTADDVVFTYEYFKDHPEIDGKGMWGDNGKLESVKKINDDMVEFVLKEKNAFGKSAIFNEVMIIPEHIWKNIVEPAKEVVENPVGTGAFTEVLRFTPQLFAMGRNPYYWQGDKLKIDRILYPQYNSNEAAYDMLQAGKIDWGHIFIPEIDKVYVAGDNTKKYWFPSHDGVRIAMNMQSKNEGNLKAFKNLHFRKAFSLAMNRKDMMEIGSYGYVKGGNPATGLPPSLWGWRNPEADKIWEEYTKYDIDKAKQELADGGFKDIDNDGYLENPDGSKIKFDIQVPSGWTDWVNNCQIAVEGLRKIGIEANVATPEVNAYTEAWTTGNFDVQFCGNGLAPNIYKFYERTMSEPYFNSTAWWSSNLTKDKNPERDALINELKVAVDKDKQKEIVDKIEMMYAKNIPHIPLYYNGKWFVYNDSRVTGWANENDPYIDPAIGMGDWDNKIIHVLHLKPVE